MAGGAETPNIAALPAIARLGACESARGPGAGRRVKLLIQFAVEGSLSGAYGNPSLRSELNQMLYLQRLERHILSAAAANTPVVHRTSQSGTRV